MGGGQGRTRRRRTSAAGCGWGGRSRGPCGSRCPCFVASCSGASGSWATCPPVQTYVPPAGTPPPPPNPQRSAEMGRGPQDKLLRFHFARHHAAHRTEMAETAALWKIQRFHWMCQAELSSTCSVLNGTNQVVCNPIKFSCNTSKCKV